MTRLTWIWRITLLCWSLEAVNGFSQPHRTTLAPQQFAYAPECARRRKFSRLFMEEDEEYAGGDNNLDTARSKKPSVRRVGGRSWRSSFSSRSNKDDQQNGLPGWLSVALPVVLLWLFFQNLFGGFFGGGSQSDFVYYQSSVYESRVIGPDGNVQTARKESMRTNIPGLAEGRQNQGTSTNQQQQMLLRESPDETFDQELDREIRTIFDDFF